MMTGRQKAMLLFAFMDKVPVEIFERRKQGFAVPIGEWFRSSLRAALHDLLFSSSGFSAGHLNRAAIERLLAEHESGRRDHTHRLFSLLMLELFWRQAGAVLT